MHVGRRRTVAASAVALVAVLVLAGCNQVVRVTTSTQQDNGSCLRPSLSADGRWTAFTTFGDPSGTTQPQKTLLKDLQTGASRQLAGDPSSATPMQALSADGSRAVFTISSGGKYRVYLWSRSTGARTAISPAGESNLQPVISANGAKVAYAASNGSAMWLHDVATGTRTAIPRPAGAASGDPYLDLALSSTGRYAVYRLFPDGGFHVRDLVGGGAWSLMSAGESSTGTMMPSISDDGRYVAYAKTHPGLLGGTNQVYVWDRTSGTSTRYTGIAAPKLVGLPSISGDGKRLAYVVNRIQPAPGQLVVIDRASKKTVATVDGNAYIDSPVLSRDGRVAAFCTPSTNLASGSPAAPNVYTWSDR